MVDTWESEGKWIVEELKGLRVDNKSILDEIKSINHNVGDSFKNISRVESKMEVEIAKIKTMGVIIVFIWSTILMPLVLRVFF